MTHVPSSYQSYFWDSDVKKMSPAEQPELIIERLLAYGDFAELKWLNQNFSQQQIESVLTKSTSLPRNVAHYLSLLYQVPFNKTATYTRINNPSFAWY